MPIWPLEPLEELLESLQPVRVSASQRRQQPASVRVSAVRVPSV